MLLNFLKRREEIGFCGIAQYTIECQYCSCIIRQQLDKCSCKEGLVDLLEAAQSRQGGEEIRIQLVCNIRDKVLPVGFAQVSDFG